LKTFNTADTNTDVSGLNHRHIIGTVADSQEERLQVAFDKLDDQSLLKGRHPTIEVRKMAPGRGLKRGLPANNSFANNR
jgi:hypothetical protein